MSANVIPFPANRRRIFIRRHACRMAEMSARGAQRYLAQQLRIQCETMARRGIAPDLVASERCQLEIAIRAEATRLIAAGVA